MLDLAILGLLEERELHGYEIRRQLREHLGPAGQRLVRLPLPGPGPLEAAGAVETVDDDGAAGAGRAPAPPDRIAERRVGRAPGPPAHARRGRRSRKVYRITAVGPSLFAELLAGSGRDDARSFGLRLAFARHLAPQARLGLLSGAGPSWSERSDEVQRGRAVTASSTSTPARWSSTPPRASNRTSPGSTA